MDGPFQFVSKLFTINIQLAHLLSIFRPFTGERSLHQRQKLQCEWRQWPYVSVYNRPWDRTQVRMLACNLTMQSSCPFSKHWSLILVKKCNEKANIFGKCREHRQRTFQRLTKRQCIVALVWVCCGQLFPLPCKNLNVTLINYLKAARLEEKGALFSDLNSLFSFLIFLINSLYTYMFRHSI